MIAKTLSQKRAEAGRKGGKVSTKKGFAAMPTKEVKRLSKKGIAAQAAKRARGGMEYEETEIPKLPEGQL